MNDPFGTDLKEFKANLHTHTTVSDGRLSPDDICKRYYDAGYGILASTDHRKTNKIGLIDNPGLTLISGMEIHPRGPRGIELHIVALNVPENFENPSDLPYQDAINKVRQAGGECILAHPYWCGLTSVDIMEIKNIIGIEVYNAACRYNGKALQIQIWDELLDAGYFLPAIAVDDTHFESDLFCGWTMIFAADNSVASIMESLKNGTYYSSTGPKFTKISLKGRTFSIECSPVDDIIFICNRNHGASLSTKYSEMVHSKRHATDNMPKLTSFESDIFETSDITYVRCQVIDSQGRYAWTNPFYL